MNTKTILALILTTIGYSLLYITDWRIGLGVCFVILGHVFTDQREEE